MEDGFEQAALFVLRRGELSLQPVAQSHKFIDLSDDALLLSERRKRD